MWKDTETKQETERKALLSRNQINKQSIKQTNKIHLSDGKKRPRSEEEGKVGVFRKDGCRYPEMRVGRCRAAEAGCNEAGRAPTPRGAPALQCAHLSFLSFLGKPQFLMPTDGSYP